MLSHLVNGKQEYSYSASFVDSSKSIYKQDQKAYVIPPKPEYAPVNYELELEQPSTLYKLPSHVKMASPQVAYFSPKKAVFDFKPDHKFEKNNVDSLVNTCTVGDILPIWRNQEIEETFCRCPSGNYGITCSENYADPCANTEEQYFPASLNLGPRYFIQCVWNVPFLKKCPSNPNLVWNQSMQRCDWPAEAAASSRESQPSYSSYQAAITSLSASSQYRKNTLKEARKLKLHKPLFRFLENKKKSARS